MAITNSMENFEMIVNEDFVKKVDSLIPELIKTEAVPRRMVTVEPDGMSFSFKFCDYCK